MCENFYCEQKVYTHLRTCVNTVLKSHVTQDSICNTVSETLLSYFMLFYVGLDRFVVRDIFLSVFSGSIVTIKLGMEHTFSSRRFDLFGPS